MDASVFVNDQVVRLPAIDDVEMMPLQPRLYQYRLWSASIWLLFLLVGIVICTIFQWMGLHYIYDYAILAWALLTLAVMYSLHRGFAIMGYAVRQHDILFRRGLIRRTCSVIPFSRVQHVEITQGPIARMMDLYEIEVFTAGGASSDMSIPGLDDDTATRLRAFIISRAGGGD